MERNEAIAGPGAVPGAGGAAKLVLGGALCLVAAGALLWRREGGDVFNRLVDTALAWCL